MSRFSGFAPIDFRLAGKLLLLFGIVGLVLAGVSKLTGWYSLPSAIGIFSFVILLVSLYLIFVVPGGGEDVQ